MTDWQKQRNERNVRLEAGFRYATGKIVLAAVEAGNPAPIVVIVDTASQNMARRELLGLNEYLAHLFKSLTLAAMHGHRTVSVLFGHAAAGAFIAAALPSQSLVALPGAEPSVMDLRSISRVTKLPLE